MENILDIIKNEISQDYYQQKFSNDGQRFVAWYMPVSYTHLTLPTTPYV